MSACCAYTGALPGEERGASACTFPRIGWRDDEEQVGALGRGGSGAGHRGGGAGVSDQAVVCVGQVLDLVDGVRLV